jgi:hypothetical protein
MTDQLVRSAFHQSILQWAHCCEDTFVVDELGLKNGSFRADIAVLNGKIVGYEIKTENDTLSRLPSQAQAYSQIFNEAFLIVAEKHIQRAMEIVPEWWGVYLIKTENDDSIRFECIRESQKNIHLDSFSIAQLLWKEEAMQVAKEQLHYNFKVKTTKKELYDVISSSYEPDNLGEIVINYLKKRETWRKDRKVPLQNDDCCQPNSIR